jgi:hypothetical protein
MLKHWISLAVLCLLGVPLLIFLAGGAIVGPYEGEQGLLGLMRVLYGDAITGHLSVIILLFSPLLIIGIWYGVSHWRRLATA